MLGMTHVMLLDGFKVTRRISSNLTKLHHVLEGYQQKPCIFLYSVYLWSQCLDNFVLAQMVDSSDVTSFFSKLVLLITAKVFSRFSSNWLKYVPRFCAQSRSSFCLNAHYSAFQSCISFA